MNTEKYITLGSLFDGIGGFPYAASFFGIKPLWASEILPQAVSVTKRHFPAMEHVGDLTKLCGGELPPVDIVTFGSPCQDLSTAGRRAGIGGARSNLFYEAIRIIDEMRKKTNGKYPTYAVWENVPGALSSGQPRGADFAAVLAAFTKTEIPIPLSGGWANAGMVGGDGTSVAWRLLNASLWGVPQRRRRIFLVANFGTGRAGEILFVEKSLRGHPAPGGETRERTAIYAPRGAGVAMPGSVKYYRNCDSGGSTFELSPQSNCLTSWDVQSRRVHTKDGAWPALYSADGGGHGYAALSKDTDCLTPWDTQQSRIFTEDGASPALVGADGGGGRNPAGLVFQPAYPAAAFLEGASAKARSIGYSEEVAPTLKSVACGFSAPYVCEPELARTLTARGDGSPNIDSGPNIVATETPAITMRLREGCEGGGKGPLLQEEKSGALATGNDQYLFSPCAIGVHQNQAGEVCVSDTAYTLSTASNASSRNAPLVAHEAVTVMGVTSKSDGDCFLTPECHGTLSRGGGQAGQGYPAILTAHPEVSGTLCASGAGLSRPAGMASEPDLCVAYALAGNMVGRQDLSGPNGNGVSENSAFTLTATDIPAVAAMLPIPIQDKATRHNGGGATRSGDGAGNGLGVGKPGDPAPTVTAGDHHAVAAVFNRQRSDWFKEQDIASTQAARQYKDATDLVCEADVAAVDCRNYKEFEDASGTLQAKNKPGYSLNFQNPVRAGYIVRRLTPTECERLQGFPDGWTAFGHDGKEISDSRRYQMLGNSVAIPCVAFVLSNIALQIRGDA